MEAIKHGDKVLVMKNDQLLQTLVPVGSFTNTNTHFGRRVLFSFPYLFITEPCRGKGVVWVYRWAAPSGRWACVEKEGCQFRLVRQIHSTQEHHGFGRALAFTEPYLFVSDCTQNDFRGCIYVTKVTDREPLLQVLYSHEEPDECVGLTLTVWSADHDMMLNVRGVHRGTLEFFVLTMTARPNRTLRHHPLQLFHTSRED